MSDTRRTAILLAEDTPASQAIAAALDESKRYRCLQFPDLDSARATIAMVQADMFLVDLPRAASDEDCVRASKSGSGTDLRLWHRLDAVMGAVG